MLQKIFQFHTLSLIYIDELIKRYYYKNLTMFNYYLFIDNY